MIDDTARLRVLKERHRSIKLRRQPSLAHARRAPVTTTSPPAATIC